MSESSPGDAAEVIETDEEVPNLDDEPDNDPDDTVEYQAVEVQDREGTERPDPDKHPED